MNVVIRGIAAGVALVALSGSAAAQSCPTGTNRVFAPAATVRGTTMCAVRGADRWQEFHATGGSLVDYKKGPGDAVDPMETVGTWSATTGDASLLTHTYTGGGSFAWAMCREGGPSSMTYTLVSTTGGTITGVTLRSGQVSC
jgi:hypothetical protein